MVFCRKEIFSLLKWLKTLHMHMINDCDRVLRVLLTLFHQGDHVYDMTVMI